MTDADGRQECPACEGTGRAYWNETEACAVCRGAGTIPADDPSTC